MAINAERKAQELLQRMRIQAPPVPIEQIAKKLGATVLYEPFEGKADVSAMLFRDGKRTIIGVNSAHSRTRQRFSVAHECGHLLLHSGKMFVDARINFRDNVSGLAVDQEEIQANAFAAAILMPGDMVIAEIKRIIGRGEPEKIELVLSKLASKFEVSTQAMEYRLKNLGLIME